MNQSQYFFFVVQLVDAFIEWYYHTLQSAIYIFPTITGRCADEGPLAIVMAPTRELAQQIDEECQKLAKFTKFETGDLLLRFRFLNKYNYFIFFFLVLFFFSVWFYSYVLFVFSFTLPLSLLTRSMCCGRSVYRRAGIQIEERGAHRHRHSR